MQSTTLSAIRTAFEGYIRGIVPADYVEHRWRPVDDIEDVPGERLRLFYMDFDVGFPQPNDSIYGCGFSWETELRVWTNYRGLPHKKHKDIIWADGHQLWLAIAERVDPTTPGLERVEPYEGFEPEADEPGQVWGYHTIVFRFLAPESA